MGSHRRLKVGLGAILVLLTGIVAVPAAVANGTGATNIALSADPPAASPADAVTYTATVSNPARATTPNVTTTPTGTVTFTYRVTGPGGHTDYVLGTSTLEGLQAGTAVASITITANVPPPDVNGGAALPDGVVTIIAAYSGDATFAANSGSTTEIIDAGCHTGPWPGVTAGYPDVFPGYPQGYYLGQVNGWWSIYVAHPEDGSTVIFSGTVKTDGGLLDVTATKNDPQDSITIRGSHKIFFRFVNHESLDGFTFYAGCGSKLAFNVAINGRKLPQADANLGNPTSNPSHRLVFKRSS
jgi:hypothetical protein